MILKRNKVGEEEVQFVCMKVMKEMRQVQRFGFKGFLEEKKNNIQPVHTSPEPKGSDKF